MSEIKVGEHDLLSFISPSSFVGALAYFILFVLAALVLSRLLRTAVHASMTRAGHIDRTTISFLQQILTALIWVVTLIVYAHRLGDTLQVAAPTGTEIGVVELISLGYTTLRAPAGHLIVVPNNVAASQVTINLNTNPNFAPWPLVISIRLSRTVDVEAARELAVKVANEKRDPRTVLGCYLTKVEADAVTLELRLVAKDAPDRDKLRSTLLTELSQRFAEAHLGGSGGAPATFS